MDLSTGHLRMPEGGSTSGEAQRSTLAEQALGRVRQGTQPLPERRFDGYGAATDARRRGRLGLCDSATFVTRDGRSRNGRREAASGGVLVPRLVEAGHL